MSRFHRSGRVEGLGGAKAPRRKRRPLHLEGLEDRRLLTAIALPDSYFLAQNGTLDVPAAGVLANDIAASENVLTVVSSTDPAHGTATVNPDGSFTYAPDLDYVGDDSFDYTITDIDANTATTTVTLTIDPANTPPVAADDAYATDEDTLLTVPAPGLLANDTGAEGATLTVSLVTGPTLGTLVLTPDGSFTYMPNANAFGTDSFTYQAGDGTSLSNAATVTLTINPVNDAPTAADDAYAIYPNGTLTIDAPGVLGNDTDVEGDPLTVAVVSDPGNGTLTLNPDGSFLYTPIIGFVGTDSFTYVANDGAADSNVATVTIKVNTPPTAADDAYATDEDTPLLIVAPGVLGNDDDPNGQPLTATVVTGPTNGTLALNPDGSFLYTPNLDYFGPDSFTYQADDGIDPSNAATVTITVNPVNDAPSAGDDTYTLLPGTTLTVDAPGVLENDTDVEGDPLTAVVVAEPTNGTLTLNPDGSFTYTPNVGFAGTDSFTYTANDGAADSNVATVTLIVNTLPLAVDDDYATDEDTPLVIAAPGVLGNDTDADGQPLTATVVAGPTNGTLALNPDGSFTYTPTANYSGPDSFTYQAGDGTDLSNVATVTITVNPVNDAPTAVDDSYTLLSNTTLTINAPGVLGNDTDPEGDPLTAVVATNPMNGTLTLNPDGSFTYTPNAGFFGSDSFTYQANDGAADSNAATVTLLVSAPPVAVDDSYSVDEDGSLQIATPGVLGNDSDPEGGTLTAVIVSKPDQRCPHAQPERLVQLRPERELLRDRQLHLPGQRRDEPEQRGDGHDYGQPRERCAGGGGRHLRDDPEHRAHDRRARRARQRHRRRRQPAHGDPGGEPDARSAHLQRRRLVHLRTDDRLQRAGQLHLHRQRRHAHQQRRDRDPHDRRAEHAAGREQRHLRGLPGHDPERPRAGRLGERHRHRPEPADRDPRDQPGARHPHAQRRRLLRLRPDGRVHRPRLVHLQGERRSGRQQRGDGEPDRLGGEHAAGDLRPPDRDGRGGLVGGAAGPRRPGQRDRRRRQPAHGDPRDRTVQRDARLEPQRLVRLHPERRVRRRRQLHVPGGRRGLPEQRGDGGPQRRGDLGGVQAHGS